ncbi:Uncharacterised protein [Mycobacteroides abscessus subsp. abscessus]|nr:Uncharacterised protein [Mycobacteroides abscessus subsp. abscessus]
MLTPSTACGTATNAPSSIPSIVDSSRPAPDSASLPSNAPAVSFGEIRSVTTPYTGPLSSAGSMRNVVAPVISSPAAIEACTGAAPRQAGSSEKCRFTQPSRGTASSSGLSRAP